MTEQQHDQAADDWLAGARIDSYAQPVQVQQVEIALNDLNLPDDGTAYA